MPFNSWVLRSGIELNARGANLERVACMNVFKIHRTGYTAPVLWVPSEFDGQENDVLS
jgi:hypothetical protein